MNSIQRDKNDYKCIALQTGVVACCGIYSRPEVYYPDASRIRIGPTLCQGRVPMWSSFSVGPCLFVLSCLVVLSTLALPSFEDKENSIS